MLPSRKRNLRGETSLSAHAHGYVHEYALTSTSNSSQSSFLCEFLNEVPLQERCLDGETAQDGTYGLDQEH